MSFNSGMCSGEFFSKGCRLLPDWQVHSYLPFVCYLLVSFGKRLLYVLYSNSKPLGKV